MQFASSILLILVLPSVYHVSEAFVLSTRTTTSRVSSTLLRNTNSNNSNDSNEAERLKKQAEELREQIRRMEDKLGDERKRNYEQPTPPTPSLEEQGKTLKKKRILVAGANGRLGSMVCRYLLRNHPETEVVACVHYIGEDSPTSRGYARLSYEVGAEDGVGQIGAAWSSSTDRTATFEYDPNVMAGYNLQNLRLVECELLDPVQCQTVVEGCDAVLWCATDFNGNAPRAVSTLDFAFLFRAVANPAKGRVEVEGLQNMMGALKNAKQQTKWEQQQQQSVGGAGAKSTNNSKNDPINFVHVSMIPKTYMDFETPFGSFWGIKDRSEQVVREDFPSLTTTILQFGQFDDTFVEEGQELQMEEAIVLTTTSPSGEEAENPTSSSSNYEDPPLRKINRRDAAKATVDALLNEDFEGKAMQVWTESSR